MLRYESKMKTWDTALWAYSQATPADYFMKCMGIQPSATLLEIQPQQGVKCEKWNQIS